MASATRSIVPSSSRCTGPDAGDHGHVGPRDLGQVGDLADAAHGQLGDHHLGVRLDPRQRQRHADLVVLVLAAGHDRTMRLEQAAQDVLGRRLAGRAGDPDHPRAPSAGAPRAPPAQRRPAGRSTSIAPLDRRPRSRPARRPRRRRTRRRRRMPPRSPCCRGGRRTGLPGCTARESIATPLTSRAPPPRRRRSQARDLAAVGARSSRAASDSSASRATVRSSKGSVPIGELLTLLVALAGDHDHVARPGVGERPLDGRAAVELDLHIEPAGRPRRRWPPDPRCAGCRW